MGRVIAGQLKGSLHLEYRRCGKPGCRYWRGLVHGPYVTRRWLEGGRQRNALVRPEDVAAVLAAIEERRALGSVASLQKSLRRAMQVGGDLHG